MINRYLELEAHKDVVNLRGGFARQSLQLSKLVGLEIVQLYIVFELP